MVANQTAPLRQFEPIHRTQLHFMHFDSLALLGLVFLALVLVLRLTAIMSSCNYHKIFVGTERNMPAKIWKKGNGKARTKLAVKQIDIVTTESSVFRILRTALVMLIVLGASRSLEACQGIDLEEEMASRTKKIRGNCQEHIASSTQFLAFSTPGFAKFRKGLHWCHYEQVSNFNVVRSWWVSVDHCRSPRTLLGIVGPPQAKCQEVVPLQRSISWLAKKMNLD